MPTLSPTASRRLLLAVVALTLGLLLWMASRRTPVEQVWADEGTYLAMAESLAVDGDLRFDIRDLDRLGSRDPEINDGRGHLILQHTRLGIFYSKPIVFALLSAPFYAVAGARGVVLLNLIALVTSLALAAIYLRGLAHRDRRPNGDADWTLVTWLLAAVVVPYVFWRMSDLVQLCLVLGGLALVLGHSRRVHARGPLAWRGAPWLGTVLIALAIPMRLSNGAFALVPVVDSLFRRRFRAALGHGLIAAAVAGSVALLSLGLTGAPDPYRAERTSFSPATGYPAGADAQAALGRFAVAPASHVSGLASWRKIAYSGFYFLAGRHTGLLVYFPAAVFFAVAAWRRRDASTWACGMAFLVVLAFFIGWKPENYFGGETFLGNRYFLPIYPLLLFALPRLPRGRTLVAAWSLALLAYASAVYSTARLGTLERLEGAADNGTGTATIDRGNQSHAHGGIFRLLPYESTAQSLSGRQDRYWSRHFLRFVDPFAEVGYQHFELTAGHPASEVLVAHWQTTRPLRLQVSADAEKAWLEVEDWRGHWRYDIGRELGPVVGLELETSPPWRHHGFWFERTLYYARALRLRLIAAEGSRARLVYLGDPVEHERAFSYQPVTVDLPQTALAGSLTELPLAVHNSGSVLWEADDVVAITFAHRLWQGERLVDEGRWPLRERVAPGEVARVEIPIRWPRAAGTYRLEIDLVQEHIAWFQQRLGAPLASREVEVFESPAADD